MLLESAHQLEVTESLEHFMTHGYARLGPVLSEDGARALAARTNALMQGEVSYPGLLPARFAHWRVLGPPTQ